MIAEELRRNAQWVLSFAERLPRISITDVQAKPVTGQPGFFEVNAHVVNLGWMATATEYAANVLKITKPVSARVTLVNAELVESADVVKLGVLPGLRENNQEVIFPIQWNVKIVNPNEPASVNITVTSEKAGVACHRIDLIPH